MVLDKYNSSFFTYEIQPGIYTFKDLSNGFFNILQPEYPGASNVIDIEIDDITTKTKFVVQSGIMAIRFLEKSFFNTVFDFTPDWDYKHYNEHISQNFINLNSTYKMHMKIDNFA